jgi:hypothetical protein
VTLLESVAEELAGLLTELNLMNWMASLPRMEDMSLPHPYLERQEIKASPLIVNLQACIAFGLDGLVPCRTEEYPLLFDVEDFGDTYDMSVLKYDTYQI